MDRFDRLLALVNVAQLPQGFLLSCELCDWTREVEDEWHGGYSMSAHHRHHFGT